MKKQWFKKDVITLISLFLCPLILWALEIPLDNNIINGKESSTNIGYVDIEKIFNEHPMAKRLQDEFRIEIEKKKKETTDMDNNIKRLEGIFLSSSTEILQLNEQLAKLKSPPVVVQANQPMNVIAVSTITGTIPVNVTTATMTIPVSVSTSTIPALNNAGLIAAKEKEIKEKEKELESVSNDILFKKEDFNKAVKRNKEELLKLENKHTNTVLADLYEILGKIAKQENLTIILDKNNVLYGQSAQDITEMVRERLQGR